MLDQYIPNPYLRALIVLVGALVVMRLILTIIFLVAKRLARKTKTDADDVLIERSKNPLTLLLFFLSLRLAFGEIVLIDSITKFSGRLIDSFIIISSAYILYLILEIIIFRAIKNFVSRTKTTIDDGILSIVQNTLRVALIVFAILYLLDSWGVQIGPFLAGLGIAGLAVALALQPTLSNIFSGIALILDKTVRVGDLVYLDTETRGTIEKVGFRSTKIKTADNELIIIPNSKLADSKIQNVALPEPRSRVTIPFSVAYGSNIQKVKKIITKELKSIKNISKYSEPTIQFIEMADSSLKFKAYFFVNHYNDRADAIDEANTRIYDILNKNHINMPYPQLDVHLKKK